MPHAPFRGRAPARTAPVLAAVLLIAATPASAQVAEDETPRVESIVFEGVSGLDEDVLADSIATQATSCRGFLLKPFCAFTDAGLFVEKHDLEPEELPRDVLRLRVLYFRKGYREARVESSVTPEGEGVRVTFTIDEGPLTTVGERRVTQTDPVLSEDAIGDASVPGQGDPLDLILLDSARTQLTTALWDHGYGDAEVTERITIDSATHVAALEVVIDPGPPTTIGEMTVEGNEQVSDYTIERLIDLPPGTPYRRRDLAEAQRRLFETELFRQAVVRVAGSGVVTDEPDSVKALTVSVREAPPRALSVGAGMSTTDFVQAQARFVRYDFLGGARRLDTRAAVGNLLARTLAGSTIFGAVATVGPDGRDDPRFLSPTWQVGAELTQPFFLTPRTSLGVGVSAHRRVIPGIVIDRGFSVTAAVTHRVQDGFPVSLDYRFERVRVEAGELYFCVSFGVCNPPTVGALRAAHTLSPLTLTARLERTDDPLAPSVGFQARLELEHASALTASDFRYQRVAGEVSRYFGVGENAVLAARVRGGWIRALAGTADALSVPGAGAGILHPRRRFLAGGARSVRGYAENQLGPRVLTVSSRELITPPDTTATPPCTEASIRARTCDPNAVRSSEFRTRPLGGSTLLEASVEYRWPLTPTLTGAVFVDAGMLRGRPSEFELRSHADVTPGIGVRYLSPIGPVRLDLALRRPRVEELPVVTALPGPDGEPELILLDQEKRYDRGEGGPGGIRGLFSRLQLHLAIGEPF